MIALDLSDRRWAAFVDGRADADVFAHPSWATLLADCYHLRGRALVIENDGEITAGLPVIEAPRLPGRSRRLVSLPFTDALRPLVDAADETGLAARLDAYRVAEGIGTIELRGVIAGAHPGVAEHVSHRLDLAGEDEESVERLFASSHRRGLRAALRNGVVVRRMESEEDLTRTYFGLHVDSRRRLGVPSQSGRFFRLLWSRMLARDLGFGLLAFHEGRPVAGAVFLAWHDTAVYKYGASDSGSWSLRPNNVLFAEAIRRAIGDGFAQLDFGRSDVGGEGLRRFKSGWGATERPLVYSTIGAPPRADRAGQGRDLVGAALRRSPALVTRALGAFYRYAA